MIFGTIDVLLLIISLLFFLRWRLKPEDKRTERNKWSDEGEPCTSYECGWIFFWILVVFLVITGVRNVASYTLQIHDQQDLQMYANKERIYENRATNLTQQFAGYLAQQYPTHEAEIFKAIGPQKIDIYLAQYPQIRSNETIMELVKQIRELQDDRYNFQIAREDTLRDMRVRLNSPWIFTSLMDPIRPTK